MFLTKQLSKGKIGKSDKVGVEKGDMEGRGQNGRYEEKRRAKVEGCQAVWLQ